MDGDRPLNPFKIGSMTWQIMEGAIQEDFDDLPGWSDLTVDQIGEVLYAEPKSVRSAIAKIKQRTGFCVRYVKKPSGRRMEE